MYRALCTHPSSSSVAGSGPDRDRTHRAQQVDPRPEAEWRERVLRPEVVVERAGAEHEERAIGRHPPILTQDRVTRRRAHEHDGGKHRRGAP